MDLRGCPAQLLHDRSHVVGLVELAPVEVDLVRRELGDDVPDAVDRGVPEQLVGVRLQRALADDGAVALVVEVALDRGPVDEAAHRRDIRLLHAQHHVVVEALVEALDEDVVRREPGTADAEAGHAHHVAHVVEEVAVELLRPRDRVEVGVEGLLDTSALLLVEPTHRPGRTEQPDAGLGRGQRVQQLHAALEARLLEQGQDRPLGVVQA